MIGEVLGNYRIVAPLGAGGMGAVWLAEHLVLGSRAAVKVLRRELSEQQTVVQRFFDEACAATRIADPGIVTVHDFGWHTDGSAYLVMEHLAGETLSHRIRAMGRVPMPTALGLLRQCAIAMSAAHARGIVHRDLKPDNIFIVPDPAVAGERIKVLDFGIAKLLGDEASHGGTLSGMILGTPGYMSPEQARGAGGVDHRTDIYALGCVLFHMVCGRPPFNATTPGDMIAAHLTQSAPAPSSLVPGLPDDLDQLVEDCLAKEAGDRIQTMTELVQRIDAVAGAPARPSTPRVKNPPAGPDRHAPGAGFASTMATGGGVTPPTTLGGESIPRPVAPWRGGILVGAVALAATVGIIVIATRDVRKAGGGGGGISTQAADARMAEPQTTDADERPAIRAAVTTPDAPPAKRDARPKHRVGGTGSGARPGSGAGTGTGSAGEAYENR